MDWFALSLTILNLVFVGYKNRIGFIFGILASLVWIYINASLNIWGGVFANVVAIALFAFSWWKWGKPQDSNMKGEPK